MAGWADASRESGGASVHLRLDSEGTFMRGIFEVVR